MIPHSLKPKQHLKLVAIFGLASIIFFSITNPYNGNSFVIVAGCVLVAVVLYGGITLGYKIFNQLTGSHVPATMLTKLAAYTSFFLLFVLLMQSIGQLSLRDVMVAVLLLVVFYVYRAYTHPNSSSPARAQN